MTPKSGPSHCLNSGRCCFAERRCLWLRDPPNSGSADFETRYVGFLSCRMMIGAPSFPPARVRSKPPRRCSLRSRESGTRPRGKYHRQTSKSLRCPLAGPAAAGRCQAPSPSSIPTSPVSFVPSDRVALAVDGVLSRESRKRKSPCCACFRREFELVAERLRATGGSERGRSTRGSVP